MTTRSSFVPNTHMPLPMPMPIPLPLHQHKGEGDTDARERLDGSSSSSSSSSSSASFSSPPSSSRRDLGESPSHENSPSPPTSNRELGVFRTHLEYTISSLERDVMRLMHHEHVHDPMYYSAEVVTEQKYADGLPIPGSPLPPTSSILTRTPRSTTLTTLQEQPLSEFSASDSNNNNNESQNVAFVKEMNKEHGLIADDLGHTHPDHLSSSSSPFTHSNSVTSSPLHSIRSVSNASSSSIASSFSSTSSSHASTPRERPSMSSLSFPNSPRASPRIPLFATSPYSSPYSSPRSLRSGQRRLSSKPPIGQYKVDLNEINFVLTDRRFATQRRLSSKPPIGQYKVDLVEEPDRYIIDLDVPNLDPENFKISAGDGLINFNVGRIRGSHEHVEACVSCKSHKEAGRSPPTQVSRSLMLPHDVDMSRLVISQKPSHARIELPKVDGSEPPLLEVEEAEEDQEHQDVLSKHDSFPPSSLPSSSSIPADLTRRPYQGQTPSFSSAPSSVEDTPRTRARSLAHMPTPLIIAE